jgi:copper transporter 1
MSPFVLPFRLPFTDSMDHDHSDHAGMDHGGPGGHGGHGGMGSDDMCSMNMLFTWDTTNLCIVFRQWHIRSTASLVISLIAVVLLAMGYEGLRSLSARYEAAVAKRINALPRQNQAQAARQTVLIKGLFYGLQNFYAFMLMLIFMTYNGWVMAAVSIGAFLGYILFGQHTKATKETACH